MSGRTLVITAITLALAGAAAGCSSGKSSGSSTPTARSSGGATAAITNDWVTFFNGSTPTSQRVALLQNGQQFTTVIDQQSQSALAKSTTATVAKVTLTSSTQATVLYTVSLAGTPALPNQTGTAILSGGTWKVSTADFCGLLALQGPVPAGCPSSPGGSVATPTSTASPMPTAH